MAYSLYWYECLAEPEKQVTQNIAAVYNFFLIDFVERSDVEQWWMDHGGVVGTDRWQRFLDGWQLTEGEILDDNSNIVEVYFLGQLFWLDVLVTIYDTPAADRECQIKRYGLPV